MAKTILLVEDSEDDVFFATRAFKAAGIVAPVLRVEDGRRAIDYLNGKGPYADRAKFPFPYVVLLDIKMPLVTGFEVLQWIRKQSSYPTVPVVMFTSSNQECDIAKAYALGANAYLVKPNQAHNFSDLAGLIKRFWLDANVPPPQHGETAQSPEYFPSPLLNREQRAGF